MTCQIFTAFIKLNEIPNRVTLRLYYGVVCGILLVALRLHHPSLNRCESNFEYVQILSAQRLPIAYKFFRELYSGEIPHERVTTAASSSICGTNLVQVFFIFFHAFFRQLMKGSSRFLIIIFDT